jgi:hypothetical protein
VPIEELRERRGGYEDRVDRQLDPLAPVDRATLAASQVGLDTIRR